MSVSNQNPYGQIMVGDDVFGADAEKLGRVADVSPGFITVEKGFFFPTDYFIPRAVVQDTADGQVYLAVSKDEALHSGWDLPPTDMQTATGMTSGTMGTMTEDELIGMRPADVQKQARVKEDVVIRKEAVQHTEQVADTVRREEVHIDEEPRAEELNP